MADQWIGLKQLEQARSARITGDGNVVLLPIPTTLADHEEITRPTMSCGSCAEKGNVARVRAQIRQGKITAAAAGQTELAEQLKTENAQLLARNRNLVNELRVVQQALAQAPDGSDGRNDQLRRTRPRRRHARSHLRPSNGQPETDAGAKHGHHRGPATAT
jgi:hypothetical protein